MIPYWDSTVDRNPSDPLWNNNFLGQFNSVWGLSRALGSATLPTPQQVQTNQSHGTYDTFWPELEGDIHNPRLAGSVVSWLGPPRPAIRYSTCTIVKFDPARVGGFT